LPPHRQPGLIPAGNGRVALDPSSVRLRHSQAWIPEQPDVGGLRVLGSRRPACSQPAQNWLEGLYHLGVRDSRPIAPGSTCEPHQSPLILRSAFRAPRRGTRSRVPASPSLPAAPTTTSIVGIFACQPVWRTMSGLKLRNVKIVPVICPTCQNVFAGKASMPATPCYFAWGCFRYFGWAPLRACGRVSTRPERRSIRA
jgi:hypothetical protein